MTIEPRSPSLQPLPCPPELWAEFSALLDEALELPESERTAWLTALSTDHAAVAPWLVKVIGGVPDASSNRFLTSPVVDDAPASEFTSGQHVGPYRLEKRLGTGGMGEVWLAARGDGTLSRQVALKLPHAHLLAGVLRRRFERERDILAALTHPHIAQLYDAGVAQSHSPYLAMEWVDGISLLDHCRDLKLPLERRLDLFLQVLDAVGYAHGRLVAHRDLKPSNILVTRDERVKLLDFGIAKLLDGAAERGATQLTRVGNCMATPAYAAPEQLAGEPVTVAVDLYALGVILHEMLTGRRPFRDNRITAADRRDAGRASTHVEEGHALSVGGLETGQLRRALGGDLDAIIGKALEVDTQQRYRSAEAFAQDLRRSRAHRPIGARRISPSLRTLKFVRRHRLGVAMAAALLVTVVGGGIGIAWQAVRAENEARRATTIKDFLVGVFRASDPRIASDKPRGEITARELLDVSAQKIENGFARQPAIQAELLGVTAEIYQELDETQRSSQLYAREAALATRALGPTDSHAIDGLMGQAENANMDGDYDRSLRLLAQADPLIHRAHRDDAPVRAQWLTMRGEAAALDGAREAETGDSLLAAVALFEKLAIRDPRYMRALIELGNLSISHAEFGTSADYYRRAIRAATQSPGMEGNQLLAYAGLALALKYSGDFPGASQAFRQGEDIALHTYGIGSRKYRLIASDWALFRYERGERDAAFAAFSVLSKDLPVNRSAYRNATDALEAAQVLRKYGHCLAIDGQGTLSLQFLERARDLIDQAAQYPVDAAVLQGDLALAFEATGRPDAARASLQRALRILEEQHASAPRLTVAHERLGRFLLNQQEFSAARAEFLETGRLSNGHPLFSVVAAQAGLASIAIAEHDAASALQLSATALEQLAHVEYNSDVRLEPYVWGVRSQALLLAGQTDAAREMAQRARDATARYYDPAGREAVRADHVFRVAMLDGGAR
jgi:serine/threonine protein kinase/tetratricopeptide (TPR) repeat protein